MMMVIFSCFFTICKGWISNRTFFNMIWFWYDPTDCSGNVVFSFYTLLENSPKRRILNIGFVCYREMLRLAWELLITARVRSSNFRGRKFSAMWFLRLMRRKMRLWSRKLEAQLKALMTFLLRCLRMIVDMQFTTLILSLRRIAKRARSFSLHG